jgi:uncharacterized membrane protein YebE (DUF533 family)
MGKPAFVGSFWWHLDDVPQPYLTLRRAAFGVMILLIAGAIVAGVLLGYDGVHHRSVAEPLMLLGAALAIGAIAGGVFAWTNKKSPRWQAWRRSMPTLTPGMPPRADG